MTSKVKCHELACAVVAKAATAAIAGFAVLLGVDGQENKNMAVLFYSCFDEMTVSWKTVGRGIGRQITFRLDYSALRGTSGQNMGNATVPPSHWGREKEKSVFDFVCKVYK